MSSFMSSMSSFFSLIKSLNIHNLSKTSYLKRRTYGDYVFLSNLEYDVFLLISFLLDLALIVLTFWILSCIQTNWSTIHKLEFYLFIAIALLFLIFFLILTYDLLVYPRLYIRNERPTCSYSDGNNTHKKGIIIDMFKGEALVEDSDRSDDTNKYLQLVKLDDINYIHKDV